MLVGFLAGIWGFPLLQKAQIEPWLESASYSIDTREFFAGSYAAGAWSSIASSPYAIMTHKESTYIYFIHAETQTRRFPSTRHRFAPSQANLLGY